MRPLFALPFSMGDHVLLYFSMLKIDLLYLLTMIEYYHVIHQIICYKRESETYEN